MALPKLPPPPTRSTGDPTSDIARVHSWLGQVYNWLGQASAESPLKAANITELLNLGSQVTSQLASVHQVVNAQLNSTNFCTVDSIDNGTNSTIRVYGTGGPGTTWTRLVGTTTQGPFPALSQAGIPYGANRYVMFNPNGNSFLVVPNFSDALGDGLIFCGALTTVSSGGTGGTVGGGRSTGGSGGCVEIGTPVIEPAGTKQEIEDNDAWVGLQFPGHSPVNMHPDTLVCVWKKASELTAGDRISVGHEGKWRTDWTKRHFYRASKKVKRTCPGGRYLAGTAQVELHNMKLANL